MTRDTLESKKSTLEDLERSEIEARRLDQALNRALSRVKPLDKESEVNVPGSEGDVDRTSSPTAEGTGAGSSVGSLSASTVKKAGSGKFGFLGALSHTLNGMVDADPEMTRRNNIGKTRDSITQVSWSPFLLFKDFSLTTLLYQLESSIQAITADLRYANSMIQADLDRFQRQKVSDFREMCLSYTNFHRDWCKKNMDMWTDAKKLIEDIDASPALLNSGGTVTEGHVD